MTGRGCLPGHEYQNFHASTGVSASTCCNRGELIMGHREITKGPRRSIAWSAGPGYVIFKIGGYVPITQGTICNFLSTPWPQGATRATQHVRSFYFPRPHPSGCLTSLQALRSGQENISLSSHARFQQNTLGLYLQLNWSCIQWNSASTEAGNPL